MLRFNGGAGNSFRPDSLEVNSDFYIDATTLSDPSIYLTNVTGPGSIFLPDIPRLGAGPPRCGGNLHRQTSAEFQ